jgi:hypothetical protein
MPDVPFADAILLLPLATLLHVAEEWPRFPRWARRFASPRYSDRAYLRTHALAIALSLAVAAVARWSPTPWVVFLAFTLVVAPGLFWNAWFHAGASLVSRSYCAGAITGIVLYLPLAVGLAGLVLREGILSPAALAAAFAIALPFHVVEVGHNVFARW